MLFLFGYGVSMDVQDVPITVDQDRTQVSGRFIENIRAGGYFQLHRMVGSPRESMWCSIAAK
jgi:ABC-2 type transport system permease protein